LRLSAGFPSTRDSTAARLSGSTAQRLNGSTESGITLIELLIVMALIALMVSISYPTLTRGLDGVQLKTSVGQAGSFFSRVRQAADRRQQPVQLTVDPKKNRLIAIAVDGGWDDQLAFQNRIRVAFPAQPVSLMLYPGHPAPRFRLLLANESGGRDGLQVNVFTGVAENWDGGGG
jgi:prepilin-type N-terminal cleavage/methylation domain-containing protein